MISEYLKGNIQFKDSVETWQEGIKLAAQPLLDKNIITNNYVEAMLKNVIDNGNYIIILPEVAMPHARHEYGALATGISFLKLNNPVLFPKDVPVLLFFGLASNTNTGHLDLISDLAEILSDPEKVEVLKQAKTEKEVLQLFDSEE